MTVTAPVRTRAYHANTARDDGRRPLGPALSWSTPSFCGGLAALAAFGEPWGGGGKPCGEVPVRQRRSCSTASLSPSQTDGLICAHSCSSPSKPFTRHTNICGNDANHMLRR